MSGVPPSVAVDWHALAPFAVLAGTLVVAAAALPPRRRPVVAGQARWQGALSVGMAAAGLVAAGVLFATLLGGRRRFFAGRVVVGSPAAVVGLVLAALGLAALAIEVRRAGVRRVAEQVVGLVAAETGLAALATARDAALCVVALELALAGGVLAARAFGAPSGSGAVAARADRAHLAGAVALAGEAYAVGVAAVIAGTTRLAPLTSGRGAAGVVAVCVLAVAIAARVGSALWGLAPAAADGRGAAAPPRPEREPAGRVTGVNEA